MASCPQSPLTTIGSVAQHRNRQSREREEESTTMLKWTRVEKGRYVGSEEDDKGYEIVHVGRSRWTARRWEGTVVGEATSLREAKSFADDSWDCIAAANAPYTGAETMPDETALRMFRREPAPVKVYDVGTPYVVAPSSSATSVVLGTLVALVGWVAILACAYVGYRLTHSGEVMSLVGLPLARLRRARPATDEGAWYYAVALGGAFVDAPGREDGEWEFDSLEEAISHARKLRVDWGEDEAISVHPFRRQQARS